LLFVRKLFVLGLEVDGSWLGSCSFLVKKLFVLGLEVDSPSVSSLKSRVSSLTSQVSRLKLKLMVDGYEVNC
jgi:hypothetical protein